MPSHHKPYQQVNKVLGPCSRAFRTGSPTKPSLYKLLHLWCSAVTTENEQRPGWFFKVSQKVRKQVLGTDNFGKENKTKGQRMIYGVCHQKRHLYKEPWAKGWEGGPAETE